jgi:DNA-directed RNA polymerase subunit E'/Rpb7
LIMFYLLNLERELEIPPRYFGPKLRSVLEERLKSEVSYRFFSGRPFGSDAE